MRDSADFARLFRGNFRAFINFAFREIHAGKSLSQNWHIDVLADQLEQLRLGTNKRLIVNIPPRSLKSFCGSVSYPAFLLGRDPRMQIMLIAGTRALAKELSEKLLRLMSSTRYRALFPHMRLRPETGSIQTGHGGFVSFAVVGQQLSGRGADLIIVDDPLSPARAIVSADRDKVNSWFDGEILTRMNDRTDGQIMVLMQRVHPGDLSGHLRSDRATSNPSLSHQSRSVTKSGSFPTGLSCDDQLALCSTLFAKAVSSNLSGCTRWAPFISHRSTCKGSFIPGQRTNTRPGLFMRSRKTGPSQTIAPHSASTGLGTLA